MASTRFATPLADMFIGLREDTGQVSIVRISDKTVLYNIVSRVVLDGRASNGTGSIKYTSGRAVVSNDNADFAAGFYSDIATFLASGKIRTLTRQFLGASGNQTIRGGCTTTGRKFEL